MIAQTTDISQSSSSNPIIKKKRKFKIFNSQPSEKESLSSIISPNQFQQPLNIITNPTKPQQPSITATNLKTSKQPIIHKTIQLLKMPSKHVSQSQFYDNDDQKDDMNIEMMNINLDECLNSKQGKFLKTTNQKDLFIQTPSFLLMNDELILNQDSTLYQLLNEIKTSYNNVEDDVFQLNQSINNLSQSLQLYQANKVENSSKLLELQSMMEQLRREKQSNNVKLKELEYRIQNSQIRRELESQDIIQSINNKERDRNNDRSMNKNKDNKSGNDDEEEDKSNINDDKDRNKSKSKQQLLIFVQQNGYQIQMSQQDEFAQSHILPAELITQFLQHRRQRIEQQNIKKQQQLKNNQINKNLSSFHPIFMIDTYRYQQLVHYICEELPQISNNSLLLEFKILFRRSVVDIESQCVGGKEDLQYKQNLIFLLKTSTNKIIGGFISNCLVEEQTMQDKHAFLFILGQSQCYKFKVKEECQHQAYMTNKFYLITFGTDLMISRNCLQEESYCQWPSSYQSRDDESNSYWFAGDFDFMIEHIEIFEMVANNKS